MLANWTITMRHVRTCQSTQLSPLGRTGCKLSLAMRIKAPSARLGTSVRMFYAPPPPA